MTLPPAVQTAFRRIWGFGADTAAFTARQTIRWPLAAGFVHAAIFSALSYWLFDRTLALALKAHLSGPLEGFFKTITVLGLAGVYLIPAALVWFYCLWQRYHAAYLDVVERFTRLGNATLYFFLTVAVSGLLVDAVKFLAGRHRPRELFDHGIYGFAPLSAQWSLNSFPSGHSETAFAAMTALVIIYPRYNALWLLIAVLVAASRVATSVHYLSDVVMGSYVGVAAAILMAREFRRRRIGVALGSGIKPGR